MKVQLGDLIQIKAPVRHQCGSATICKVVELESVTNWGQVILQYQTCRQNPITLIESGLNIYFQQATFQKKHTFKGWKAK
jgi:hypothetical protein